MALLGKKETAEEKQQRQLEEFQVRYGLENLAPADLMIVQRVANDLMGNKWFKAGLALSFAKAEEQAKVTYLSALVEQNWIIMNQLSRLNKNLEALLEKQA
jgi:hypothetical protein